MPSTLPGRGAAVYTAPRDEAHLQAILAELNVDAADTTTDLTTLEDAVGAETFLFDTTINAGQPVFVSSADHVDLADASAIGTADVVGLAFETSASSGLVSLQGRLTLADWTNVIGSANLTAGATYWLSTTAGMLTATAPTAGDEVVKKVGIAISQTEFQIQLGPDILL